MKEKRSNSTEISTKSDLKVTILHEKKNFKKELYLQRDKCRLPRPPTTFHEDSDQIAPWFDHGLKLRKGRQKQRISFAYKEIFLWNLFGQRTRRGRRPMVHRGEIPSIRPYVCTYVRMYVRTSPPCPGSGPVETGWGLPEAGSGLSEAGSGLSEAGLGLC